MMTIEHRPEALMEIFVRYAGPTTSVDDVDVKSDQGEWTQADKDLCARIAGANMGDRFQKLFAGQFQDYYGSQSEADLALCNSLAFWTAKNSKQMDRIFRQSGLCRPKWDERHGELTYGQMTLQKAIAGTENVYQEAASTSSTGEESLPDYWFKEALANGSVSRFIDHAPPELDWVFDGSLLVKTVGALVGPGGVGKSTLMLEMLISVATGRDILPGIFKPTRAGKVLAIFAEEDETILHHRFKGLMDGLFVFDDEAHRMLKENMLMIAASGHDLRMLTSDAGGEKVTVFFNMVLESVKSIPELRLIVVDPLSRFFGAGENDNGAGTLFISLLEKIAQATGAAVIACHHVGKKAGYANGNFDLDAAMHQDAARGASALTNGARWQCNLVGLPEQSAKKHCKVKWAKPGQFLALQVSKKNYGKPEPVHFLERLYGGVLRPYNVVDNESNDPDLDAIILKLLLGAIHKADQSGNKHTKRTIIDGSVSDWKKDDNRITRPKVEQTIAKAILGGEIYERVGKNASGKAINYLSLVPQREPEDEPLEPEIEPEVFEPEKPEETVENGITVHNSLILHDSLEPEELNCRNEGLRLKNVMISNICRP